MTFVGCDLHTRQQQVAVLDTTTGEIREQQLLHEGTTVEDFYAALPRPVTVGIESTGYAIWFHALLQRLGHTVLVGDAAKIRAMVVRKTKTDRRDALHILDLLRHDRFPTIWLPDPATRELRALLMHRMRLVRIQTMLKNGVQALALNQGLVRGSKLLRTAGLAQLQAYTPSSQASAPSPSCSGRKVSTMTASSSKNSTPIDRSYAPGCGPCGCPPGCTETEP